MKSRRWYTYICNPINARRKLCVCMDKQRSRPRPKHSTGTFLDSPHLPHPPPHGVARVACGRHVAWFIAPTSVKNYYFCPLFPSVLPVCYTHRHIYIHISTSYSYTERESLCPLVPCLLRSTSPTRSFSTTFAFVRLKRPRRPTTRKTDATRHKTFRFPRNIPIPIFLCCCTVQFNSSPRQSRKLFIYSQLLLSSLSHEWQQCSLNVFFLTH